MGTFISLVQSIGNYTFKPFWFFQDLNNETLAHLDAENRRQTLEEEIEFLKKVHEQVSKTKCLNM